MLSAINTSLQAAFDLVVPPCARVEDLKYHWQQVLQECQKSQESGAKGLIVSEETHAPRHLRQMLQIMVDDVSEYKNEIGLSPCMEYVIQDRILVSLSAFAWADRPLGIRQYSFMFLFKALNHLHHSYLHQMRIHKPLQVMIKATCEKKASPYENQEINFLSAICHKIQQDPSIILLHIEPLMLTNCTPSGFTPNLSGLCTPTPTPSEGADDCPPETPAPPGSKFPLVEALLNLCHSNDTKICLEAHNCLMIITNLKEAKSAEAIAKHTLLAHYVASRLTTAAEAIPPDTEPAFIERIDITEHEKSSSDEEDTEEFMQDFDGKKEVEEFLSWVELFDRLLLGCDCFLATNICSIVRELFLDGFFGSVLVKSDEADDDALALHISLLTKMLLIVNSSVLINTCIMWLTEDIEENREGMSQALLGRCILPPSHLQIQTLRLLQILLEKPECLAAQILAINFVSSRNYFDSTTAEHQQNSWSDEEDERYKLREDPDLTPGTLPISRTLAPTNISKIVKTFLSIVPDEIRSTTNEDFESYKADALRQYREVCRRAPYHTWPREAIAVEPQSECGSSSSSKESKPEVDRNTYHDGPFLRTILDLLAGLPEQDYDVNLQTTSLVASLALIPHPHLHELLLNPLVPLSEGARSPYSILKQIVERIKGPIMTRKDYAQYLRMTRFQLLGTMEELQYERDENDSLFEALVVIEEFTKELAAIAYAKYTCEGNLL